jgi:hypothetical protein
MTTSTKELIDWLNVESKIASGCGWPIATSRFRDSAQRLRELDKPDCVWKLDSVGANTYESSCGRLWSFEDGGIEDNCVAFCHCCGGAVKGAT